MVTFSESEIKSSHSPTEDDEEFTEETISERLWGLTEMFPEVIQNSVGMMGMFSIRGGKNLFWFTSRTIWVASTSFMILVLPIMLEIERVTIEEQQLQQQRQILLGPNAATPGYGTNAHGMNVMPSLPGQPQKS